MSDPKEQPSTPTPPTSDYKKKYYLALLLARKFLAKLGPDFKPEFIVARADEVEVPLNVPDKKTVEKKEPKKPKKVKSDKEKVDESLSLRAMLG